MAEQAEAAERQRIKEKIEKLQNSSFKQ